MVRLAVVALLYLFLAALLLVVWRDISRAAPGRRGSTGRAFLVVVDGPHKDFNAGQRIPVEGAASIGRESDNQVVIQDKTVSGRHAAIVYRGGRWWAEDLGSTNGTWVNDRRIDGPQPVDDGDLIQTGRFSFRFSS